MTKGPLKWILLAACLAGCQQPAPPASAPTTPAPPVARVEPVAEMPTDPPLPPETLRQARPKRAATRPPLRDPYSRSEGQARSTAPLRPARSQRVEADPQEQQAAVSDAPPSPAAKPRAPSFALPEPDYPQAAPAIPRPTATAASGAPAQGQTVLTASNGLSEEPAGELFLLDEQEARPIYHPAVVIDEWRDEQWLTVQFDIAPNGRFRVYLLEGTGDPALDALALETLRQWRWQPKTIRRRPVASSEILRLKRNVTRYNRVR